MAQNGIFIAAVLFGALLIAVPTARAASCADCNAIGNNYYCDAHGGSCHWTWATCEAECIIHRGHCHDTSGCGPNMTCPDPWMCNATTSTCCMSSDMKPFCAPYPKATCCNYKNMSCAHDQACDPITNTCAQRDLTNLKCKGCITLMNMILSKGCSAACAAITPIAPELIPVCKVIALFGCSKIVDELKKFQNPEATCSIFGVCGGGNCPCGLCSPDQYGQRCLAFPNKCPRGASELVDGELRSLDEIRRTFDAKAVRANVTMKETICVDGFCERKNLGCCLTCV